MAVPFVDLARDHGEVQEELQAAFERVLRTSAFVLGPEVRTFETGLASWLGAGHVVGVQSGTTALMAALTALEVGPGDEVITVANTFVATVGAIVAVGATPVLVDAEPRGLLLDPARLEAAVSPRTRAIIPVHLYGQPADMDPVMDLARRRSLAVIEDAAQAQGARYRGALAGTLADLACFSFYPGKNLGALGEGGAVVTGDPERAERVRRFINHGGTAKYEHVSPGINGRLEAMQAAFLAVKLPHVERWNARRRAAAARYEVQLQDLPLVLPEVLPERDHVFHLYVIRTRARDALMEFLAARGVQTGIHYPAPVHRVPAFAGRVKIASALDVSEAAASELLSLPIFGTIRDDEVDEVCARVREFFQKGQR